MEVNVTGSPSSRVGVAPVVLAEMWEFVELKVMVIYLSIVIVVSTSFKLLEISVSLSYRLKGTAEAKVATDIKKTSGKNML